MSWKYRIYSGKPLSARYPRCFWALLCLVLTPLSVFAESRLFPDVLTQFSVIGDGSPIFSGTSDAWDGEIRERGWILKDGGTFKMWYTGYRSDGDPVKRLGYATSSDGRNWRRYPGNPIYDGGWIEDVMVLKHDDRYVMFAEGAGDRAQWLVSPDGLHWRNMGVLDIRRRDGRPIDDEPFGTPTVWYEDGRWYLYYERKDKAVWLAVSDDLIHWTNIQDAPVLRPGPDQYDSGLIALNQVIKYDGKYYAYYHGAGRTEPRTWNVAIALSDDLIHWYKYHGNPLLIPGKNESSGIVVDDGRRFRLYTMHAKVRLYQSPPYAKD